MSPRPALLTREVLDQMRAALAAGHGTLECSLDLHWSSSRVEIDAKGWQWRGTRYPYPAKCKERTIYAWDGAAFEPVSRFTNSLIKLVPTRWGPPTFEIDGIKMLPSEHVSPFADAEQKVALIAPRGKSVLDTCGGLGYFAAWCLQQQAAEILSFEKNPDVIWLRGLNPWSPVTDARLSLLQGDICTEILKLPTASFEAILHDPPRFGIAGELYSQSFYDELFRVLKRQGRLFHYTGSPNKLTSGRDVPAEVHKRLERAGFQPAISGDGILALRR